MEELGRRRWLLLHPWDLRGAIEIGTIGGGVALARRRFVIGGTPRLGARRPLEALRDRGGTMVGTREGE